ncbi:P-loop containing nucleoside triphosphate hydrolase protein [Scleroderma yunnanense]
MGQVLSGICPCIVNKVHVEETKATFPSPVISETVYVAVMGSTGSGKTTFINVASGSDLKVGMGLESCTNEVQTSIPFTIGDRQILLLDTPGFDDTTMTDTDVLRIISAYLFVMHKQGIRLIGIVYMQRISDFNVGSSARRDLRMFQELCGEEAYGNVIVVTNMWGTVPEEDGVARETELATKDVFYKPILERKGVMEPTVLRIQRELAEGKDITQTAAFRQLDRELSELALQRQKNLEQLKADMARAEQEMDEETQNELAEEKQKLEEELRTVQTQASTLAFDYQAELRKVEEKLNIRGLTE